MKRFPVLLLLLVAACGPPPEDPILRLSAPEAFAEGKRLMEESKYARAREYFTHAFEVEPNSAEGREALLLSADAYYLAGGVDNYTKAEAKYRDFQNRFPTSERAAYVQFQMAKSLANRVRDPDRDQTATRKALAAFDDLLRLYPTSDQALQAETDIAEIRAILAEHEFMVGEFNYKRKLFPAAAARFEGLLEEFPEYPGSDEALFLLGGAQVKMRKIDEAKASYARLKSEFPQSPFVAQVPNKLPAPRPTPPAPPAEPETTETPVGAAEGEGEPEAGEPAAGDTETDTEESPS